MPALRGVAVWSRARTSAPATHHCLPRLLRALDHPGVAVPVHGDGFAAPYDGSPERDPAMDPAMDLDASVAQVQRVPPVTRVVVPDHDTVYGGGMRPVGADGVRPVGA